MFFDKYAEHLAHSEPCASRWDGFDRGDDPRMDEPSYGVIGRMTAADGARVVVDEYLHRLDSYYTVYVDGVPIHEGEDRGEALAIGRARLRGVA